ncbi:MAG: methylmalonyl-CoA epimerase [Candidatus Nealsonbacteria bacterium]|nr:methylmalonyl-CoA epimerase [Candidatus Nealsonbacteria bacterium]
MIKRVDHIALAVKNLDETLKVWHNLFGLKPSKIEIVPEQKVKAAILRVGRVKIELLEPVDSESTITKFLEKKGEGLHHIAFEVDKINEEIIIGKKVRNGLVGKVGFIHPKDTSGVLVELVQK